MNRLSKLLVIGGLAGVISLGSFGAGMIFDARFIAPMQQTVISFAPGNSGPGQQSALSAANPPKEFATFWEAWSFLDDQFYGEIPADSERVYGAIRGMVNSFGDQHTAFIDPARAAVMSENISGSFEGIGATIRLDDENRMTIIDAQADRPAFKVGLRPGDMILKVDGEPVEGLSLYEGIALIRGPAGSVVVLTISRPGEPKPFDVSVIRAKIEIEVVESNIVETAPAIGYVRLTQFSNGASKKVAEAITELTDKGATALIFDLRGNPGGLLSEAVDVSSLFVSEGTVVIEKLKGGEEKRFEAKHRSHVATDIPLVLLVNGGSASASEIVAGAMQDLERATLVGEQTFGKGSVQLPHDLSDGSELRVTIAEWLTPAYRQIHGQGITPDIVVEMTPADIEQQADPQLAAAVEYLQDTQQLPLSETTK